MYDLGIIEASDDLEDGVDRSDMGQESVSKTSSSGGSSSQASDIIDGQIGGYS